MRLGIAQIDTVPGAFDETVERMVAQSRRAAEQGVELLAFPLAALAGVDVVPFSDRISYMRDVADAVASLSEHLACPAIVAVPMDLGDAEGFYEVLLVEHGEVRPLRMMSHLHGQASPGGSRDSDVPEFDYGGLHFALALSHADLDDLDDYDYDIDAVLFLSGYPFAMDDPSSAMGADLEGARFVDDARTMQAWLAGVAPVGGYGDEVFSGSSFVLAPSGDLVASAPAFEEALICADLEAVAPELPVPPLAPEVFDAPFHLWQAVSLGIHDFVTKQGRSDVALCLDGTLAAFVLAALASDALGPLHVHVLVGASAGRRAPSCRELVARLRVDHVDAVGRLGDFDPRDLDELQLAALAREHDAVVLSSLDKTALALGVGVGAVSAATLCPLGDVYRSDVLDMAHVRNTISPLFRRVRLASADVLRLPMPDGSVRRIATEREVTALDEVLLGYIEYDRPLVELAADGADAGFVDAVLRAERSAEPMRRAMPPVLAMSSHTLDDARFPLGVRWHDTHLDQEQAALDLLGRREAPSDQSQRGHEGDEHAPTGADIDGTLSMLRDFAEQGGFIPSDFASLMSSHDEEGGPVGHGVDAMGWMSPFSEN